MLVSIPAWAHRLDEYLQATLFSIEPNGVQATMRLVPGVAVAPVVLAAIDTNHDGVISNQEQRRYAESVLGDLQLEEDGRALTLHLVSAAYPAIDLLRQGTGEIALSYSAAFSAAGGEHQLRFENHHQSGISVYLVNSLLGQDRRVELGAQSRNPDQSAYQVTFTQASGGPSQRYSFSGFGAAFRLGMRHIAQGTDHVLFLLTLLLPAPLLALRGSWSGRATVGHSVRRILEIVTAFTFGHSLTLALSGFGLVHLPSRPVEALIAISILVSAIHAIRPLFPGREVVIAASFGLVHGLAFASALNELGVTGWYRSVSLLGFNLGIEVMQLGMVVITLPALLLLSRTAYYAVVRTAGAVIAAIASSGWIIEQMLSRPNTIGYAMERLANHGAGLCAGLWLCAAAASQPCLHARRLVFANHVAIFHHKGGMGEHRDVFERVAGDGDDVGVEVGAELTDAVGPVEEFGSVKEAGLKGIGGAHAEVNH